MTKQQKQAKIIAAVQTRGWFTCDVYWNEACELRDAGAIKQSFKFTTGGNQKPIWVKGA